MKYLVSYDISDPKDSDAVRSKLDSDKDAKPVLKSQWILDKDNTTEPFAKLRSYRELLTARG